MMYRCKKATGRTYRAEMRHVGQLRLRFRNTPAWESERCNPCTNYSAMITFPTRVQLRMLAICKP